MSRQGNDVSLDLFVGAYSSAAGQGLVPLTYRPGDDSWASGRPIAAIENASFGACNARHRIHYFVDERADGRIGAYQRSGDGAWRCLSIVRSGGDGPCFVAVNSENTALAVANYDSGSIGVFRLDLDTGAILDPPIVRQNTGRGPDAERQESPHAYCVLFRGGRIYSVDLGTDQILAHPFDARAHQLGAPSTAFAFPGGEGPRHMLFHPTLARAYALTELGNRVFVFATNSDGRLDELQQLTTLPANFSGHSIAAHLALNQAGDRLYASNRGHNSIAVFAIADDGRLNLMQVAPTHGDSPRFFLLLESHRRLIVAHQKSNSLVVLQLEDDGAIGQRLATISTSQPVFVGMAR